VDPAPLSPARDHDPDERLEGVAWDAFVFVPHDGPVEVLPPDGPHPIGTGLLSFCSSMKYTTSVTRMSYTLST
jgi:hypothetical protein